MLARSTWHRRVAAATLAVAICGGLIACGDEDEDASKAAATASCPASITATAEQQPPSGVPLPDGARKAYQFIAQGKTHYFRFALSGDPDRLASLRDAYDKVLTSRGYTITGTDQEEGAEAESEFSGPHDGHTQWRNLCSGKVRLQLELDS